MNPLSVWAGQRIGAPATRENIDAYQYNALHDTISHVKKHSRFYRERLTSIDISGGSTQALLRSLPFCGPGDLRSSPTDFLCVSQAEVSRVVTASWLETSGTTGRPKRLFFTPAELETTTDFFDYGMRNMVKSGGKTMIFMRGENTADGVCGLLTRALARFGATGIAYGFVRDPEHARRALIASGADCAVGVASQMASIAKLSGEQPCLRSLLLAADNIPKNTAEMLKSAWSCEVFSHFGMTETCFAGAVDCPEHTGMHVCEPDFIFEIIDPVTGEQLPNGEYGELVLTTLTRRATPLLRYRTGDMSRILTGKCACGCELKRLDNVTGHAEKFILD